MDPSTSPDHVADISQAQQVEEMFRAIERDLGGLDVLVNNVGIAGPAGLVDEIDPVDFDEVLRVNISGTFSHSLCSSATPFRRQWLNSQHRFNSRYLPLSLPFPLCGSEMGDSWARAKLGYGVG